MEQIQQDEPPRRTFMKWCIHGLSALFTVVFGAPALAYLIDPLNRPKPPNDYRRLDGVKFSDLVVGQPRQGIIRNVRHDAWALHPNDVVGRVWVVKETSGKVKVFTTVCPHLGCSINDAPGGFACPCHGARFDIQGDAVKDGGQNPAPRGMDTLEFQADPKDADVIQVKYENFRQGVPDKEVRA